MCIVCGMQLNPPDLQVSVSLRYIRTQRPYPAKGGKTYFEQCMRAKGAEIEPGTQAHILCEPAQAKRMSRFHKSRFLRKFFGKNVAPQIEPGTQTHILREPAQSKCMSTCHKRHQKSHFIRTFTGKMPPPRLGPECRHTLCASLRSRNACQDFTRATLHGNLQEKCRSPE